MKMKTWDPIVGGNLYAGEGPLRFNKKHNHNLADDNVYIVTPKTDIWVHNVPDEWITDVLAISRKYDSTFIFWTRNPRRWTKINPNFFPKKTVFSCVIETNLNDLARKYSAAPTVTGRVNPLVKLSDLGFYIEVVVDPIMDFDDDFADQLISLSPNRIIFGASKENDLDFRPSKKKVFTLLGDLVKAREIDIRFKQSFRFLC